MTQRQVTQFHTGLMVRDLLAQVAAERNLKQSTTIAYQRCLTQLGVIDEPVSAVTKELIEERAWALRNVNTRRGALVCARAVFGFPLRVPRGVPRRYELPSETDLRFALLLCPRYETYGLAAMGAGLRLGEAAALTRESIVGHRLRIDRQVQTLRQTGQPSITRITSTKSSEREVWAPEWLLERVAGITDWVKPDPVREGIKRALVKAGLPNMCFHGLRHWYATTALERGASITLVSRSLGHSDVATTLRTYVDTSVDDMAKFFT